MLKKLLSVKRSTAKKKRRGLSQVASRSIVRVRTKPTTIDSEGEPAKESYHVNVLAVVTFLIGLGLLLGGVVPQSAEYSFRERVITRPCNVTSVTVEKMKCLDEGDGVMTDVTSAYVGGEDVGSSRRSLSGKMQLQIDPQSSRVLRRNRQAEGCSEYFRVTVGVEYLGEDGQHISSSAAEDYWTSESIKAKIEGASWTTGSKIQCLFDPEDSSGEVMLSIKNNKSLTVLIVIGSLLIVVASGASAYDYMKFLARPD